MVTTLDGKLDSDTDWDQKEGRKKIGKFSAWLTPSRALWQEWPYFVKTRKI